MKNRFDEKYNEFMENKNEMKPTQEMIDWFEKRTNTHIGRVQKNWRKFYGTKFEKYLDELDDKEAHILKHDASKFESLEYLPYIFTTWKYKQNGEGKDYEIPKGMKEKADDATTHHVLNNPHHPEYWDKSLTVDDEIINTKDRDKAPDKLIDGTKMPDWALLEMCADWVAVSEERKSNPFDWLKLNTETNLRWKFTEKQLNLIKECLSFLWDE